MSTDADFSAFERAGWNERATGYDRRLGRVTARTVEPLLDAAAVGAGTRVLDVACGPGYACAAAAARAARPVGVDIAPIMINLARRHNPDLDFVVSSAEALPFAAGSFAAVVGNFLVHHLAEADRTLRELARVLAPGGRLALTAWDVPEKTRLIGVLTDAIAEVGAPPPDLPPGPPFFRFAADDAFAGLLASAGLHDVQVRTITFAHPFAGADELWAGLIGGTVRTAALVLRQPVDVQRRIRAAFDRQVARYADGPRLALPISVKLAAGRRR